METLFSIMVGVFFLTLGFLLGNLLAKATKEELNPGKIWFKVIILISVLGVFLGLIIRNDSLLFSFLFILILTSRSLKKKVEKEKEKKKKKKFKS